MNCLVLSGFLLKVTSITFENDKKRKGFKPVKFDLSMSFRLSLFYTVRLLGHKLVVTPGVKPAEYLNTERKQEFTLAWIFLPACKNNYMSLQP